MSEPYKDWIVRFYANHNDIPEGHADGRIVGELIRCKECRFYQGKYCTAWDDVTVAVACETDADGYCYRAKRK